MAAADIASASNLFQQFRKTVSDDDLEKSVELLSQMKIKLTEFQALPPLYQSTPTATEELTLARDILEDAVLLAVKLHDEHAFERSYLQLKTYYTDSTGLPPSPRQDTITGLNLLRLLVQNRIAEFHTELELISPAAQASRHVKYALVLEQRLMEGGYNKVLAARKEAPDDSYAYFVDLLLETVRDEIASCSEKAYDSLAVKEAQKLMLFDSAEGFLEYATNRGWNISGGVIDFKPSAPSTRELPSMQIVSQALAYARELERIV